MGPAIQGTTIVVKFSPVRKESSGVVGTPSPDCCGFGLELCGENDYYYFLCPRYQGSRGIWRQGSRLYVLHITCFFGPTAHESQPSKRTIKWLAAWLLSCLKLT